jgi:hypothetical protein
LKKVLHFISYLLHPVFIPIFGTLFYFLLGEGQFNTHQKYLILVQIAIITFLIPIAFFFLLRSLGKIDSVMLSNLAQRKIPLFIQAILLYILISKSITINVLPELFFFFAGALASALIALLLTFFKVKASLHMVGISALTAFVTGLSYHAAVNAINSIGLLVFLNGVVATSRLEMKAHSGKELVIGFCVGLLPQLALWYFWL